MQGTGGCLQEARGKWGLGEPNFQSPMSPLVACIHLAWLIVELLMSHMESTMTVTVIRMNRTVQVHGSACAFIRLSLPW